MFWKDLMLMIISSLILIISVLVSVAFLTLLERKVLGYIQVRKGPNKAGVFGVFQPFSDAIKLFSKESEVPLLSNYFLYYFSPIFNLFLSLLLWLCMPFFTLLISFNLGVLYFLCCSSVGVYFIMFAGWSSNSNYSMLGSLRAAAQSISYEVSLFLILLSVLILIMSLSILDLMKYQKNFWFLFLCLPLMFIWFISSLAETNRTPFDFAEGESELVSGFNIEYSSGGFALIFLAEYSSIMFMSMLNIMLFFGGDLSSFFFFLKLTFLSFVWIWVRGTLPRFRYDKLMSLAWKSFLLVSLNFLMFFMGMKLFIFLLIL